VPHVVDFLRLREEAMAAQVEAVAVLLDRLGDAAELVLGLHDENRLAALGEVVRSSQAGRAAADYEVPAPRCATVG
jgi:hypothetical protein